MDASKILINYLQALIEDVEDNPESFVSSQGSPSDGEVASIPTGDKLKDLYPAIYEKCRNLYEKEE